MTTNEEIKPSVEFSMSEAAEELTGFETIALEKKLGKRLDAFGVGELAVGLVYTFERRTNPKVSWDDVASRRTKELSGFFAPESDDDEIDDDAPKA